MKKWINRLVGAVILLMIVGAVAYSLMPRPVMVDSALVTRGPLRVTVDEDGKTRIREKYVVSAPLSGRLLRIDLDPGDAVVKDQTPVAVIEPRDPELLDARALAEARARVQAATASLEQAGPMLEAARAELAQAEADYTRIQEMADRGAATVKELDDAALMVRLKSEAHQSARFGEEIARFELELARAALVSTTPNERSEASTLDGARPAMRPFVIRSPGSGRVLRVFQESEAVISAGSPLVEVGDPSDLELEVDVLSSDAVRIDPGATVILEHWGEERPLRGKVRRIEPAAFTKVSALGVEEQRVNVIVDLTDPPEARAALGDGFRVEARIVVWEAQDALKAPTSALFRDEGQWAVFRIENGAAKVTPVRVGGRTGLEMEILEGLSEGDHVIIHPSDQIADGVSVTPR